MAQERFRNLILRNLDAGAVDRLDLRHSALVQGQHLQRSSVNAEQMVFIEEGIGSMTTCFEDGSQVESGVFGFDSAIGAGALMGVRDSTISITVQVPGHAWFAPLLSAAQEFRRRDRFHDLLLRYAQSQLIQASQSAACNARHNLQQRLSRWLLACRDRVSFEVLPLTQEFLAIMLGVERPAVSVVAGKLQDQGLIEYSRGRVRIVDPPKLEALSCECYQILRREKENFVHFAESWGAPEAAQRRSKLYTAL